MGLTNSMQGPPETMCAPDHMFDVLYNWWELVVDKESCRIERPDFSRAGIENPSVKGDFLKFR
jgi:hypothetical protein